MSRPPQATTIKRWILTIGVTVITISGAYLGANLKTEHQKHSQIRKITTANYDEQITVLEDRRARLVGQRSEVAKKIEAIKKRQEKKAQQEG